MKNKFGVESNWAQVKRNWPAEKAAIMQRRNGASAIKAAATSNISYIHPKDAAFAEAHKTETKPSFRRRAARALGVSALVLGVGAGAAALGVHIMESAPESPDCHTSHETENKLWAQADQLKASALDTSASPATQAQLLEQAGDAGRAAIAVKVARIQDLSC